MSKRSLIIGENVFGKMLLRTLNSETIFVTADDFANVVVEEIDRVTSSKEFFKIMWDGVGFSCSSNLLFRSCTKFSRWLEIDTVLRQLTLSKQDINLYSPDIFFGAISKNKTIRVLSLEHMAINGNHCEYVANMLESNTAIQEFSIARNCITDRGLKIILRGLAKNRTVKDINVIENLLTIKSGFEIYYMLYTSLHHTIRQVRVNQICENQDSNDIYYHILNICYQNTLVSRAIEGQKVPQVALDISHGKCIRCYNLSPMRLENRLTNSQLKEIDTVYIFNTLIRDVSFLHWFGHGDNQIGENLRNLVLIKCGVTEDAIHFFLLNFPQLKHMNITN